MHQWRRLLVLAVFLLLACGQAGAQTPRRPPSGSRRDGGGSRGRGARQWPAFPRARQASFPAGPGAFDVAVGDIDEDGNPDVVASSFESDAVMVLLGRQR